MTKKSRFYGGGIAGHHARCSACSSSWSLRIGENVTANSRITGLINNFLADFSQAKLLASAENRYVAITFSADGRSYTIPSRPTSPTPPPGRWSRPSGRFRDRTFFDAGDVSDFAINSTGEVRPLPIDPTPSPSGITLASLSARGGAATDEIAYRPHHPNISLWRVES